MMDDKQDVVFIRGKCGWGVFAPTKIYHEGRVEMRRVGRITYDPISGEYDFNQRWLISTAAGGLKVICDFMERENKKMGGV